MVGHDFLFSEVVTARKLGAPRANKKQFVDPRKKLDAVGVGTVLDGARRVKFNIIRPDYHQPLRKSPHTGGGSLYLNGSVCAPVATAVSQDWYASTDTEHPAFAKAVPLVSIVANFNFSPSPPTMKCVPTNAAPAFTAASLSSTAAHGCRRIPTVSLGSPNVISRDPGGDFFGKEKCQSDTRKQC